MSDENLSEGEKRAYRIFKAVTTNFLTSFKGESLKKFSMPLILWNAKCH
jgi:hypothetical protein